MNKATEFLKNCGTFYLGTVEGEQPRVRPFGAVSEINGKVYICTNNTKPVFKQMKENPKVEICGFAADGTWIRIAAKAIPDPDRDVKAAMLNEIPALSGMYSVDDGIFEVLYLGDATATISSFAGAPDTFTF